MCVLWSWFFSSSFPIDPSTVCTFREQLLLIVLFPMLSKPGSSEVAFCQPFLPPTPFLKHCNIFFCFVLSPFMAVLCWWL